MTGTDMNTSGFTNKNPHPLTPASVTREVQDCLSATAVAPKEDSYPAMPYAGFMDAPEDVELAADMKFFADETWAR